MLRLLLLGIITIGLLGGCGNDQAANPNDPEGLYKKSCVGCHGENLEGASGPAVKNMADKYTQDELYTLIMEGKGMMPGNLLSEAEAKKVTEWMMTK
ncbi:c-type cytochrome [Bacillus marasmi]|uniref:c-type cytochrome n=1 Tax=Bacillus marasmi TaxID=1926279 RepID=UPI0011C8447B|nr:cytochrome c [Bacillus marasmi]